MGKVAADTGAVDEGTCRCGFAVRHAEAIVDVGGEPGDDSEHPRAAPQGTEPPLDKPAELVGRAIPARPQIGQHVDRQVDPVVLNRARRQVHQLPVVDQGFVTHRYLARQADL